MLDRERMLPNPLCSGAATGGPPASDQLIRNLAAFIPEAMTQSRWTDPCAFESAPYLPALVANSCSAMPIA